MSYVTDVNGLHPTDDQDGINEAITYSDGFSECQAKCEDIARQADAEVERLREKVKIFQAENEDLIKACEKESQFAECTRKEKEKLRGDVEKLKKDLDRETRAADDVMKERDIAEEWADKLSLSAGTIEQIGEHSSANLPWANALELIEDMRAELSKIKSAAGSEDPIALIEAGKVLVQNFAVYDEAVDWEYEMDLPNDQRDALRKMREASDIYLSAREAKEKGDA